MAKKKSIKRIVNKFQKEMQNIINKDSGIDKISIGVGNEKPIVIAEKKK